MYENDPRVTVGRLVESFSHGHGRIHLVYQYYGFYVRYNTKLVFYSMHENYLKFFNDEETDYLPLT